MQTTFICQGCGQEKPANVRLKVQQFCGDITCQRLRKKRWHNSKMQTDPIYRAQQIDSRQQWRRQRPAYLYQREYRHNHPDYVESNREQQRSRNQKREPTAPTQMIVKMDALRQIESNTYVMTPLCSDTIVKMDSLLVQFKVLQGVTDFSP